MPDNLELLEKNQLVNIVKTQNETISFLVNEVEKYFKLYNLESDKYSGLYTAVKGHIEVLSQL